MDTSLQLEISPFDMGLTLGQRGQIKSVKGKTANNAV